ncbi:hypothetical protein [Aequorivita lipolytica]|uniref:Uncharacterized protein n=1 Tax=Aequorivita lipolytica TaxID=153267 RepID=A0A5C6YLT7_9FLAO|nr:hypothetical protein [Aequorivita lipolytica]TXD68311.1 hypothetical protein ESV24_12660 [Aequorivita lipolytica]SRX53419.1 hypothetical protein AEQU2_02649 [Aequorivita lipolytica]
MNLNKNFAQKNDGYYEEENIKNIFSILGRMVYQPKKAKFLINGSKISMNLDEVGGAIPTAEPYRITLHLSRNNLESIEIYPVTFLEKIIRKLFPSKNKKLKNKFIFQGSEKFIEQLVKEKSLLENLQKQKVYIRIPKKNTSKIILTPPHGIEDEAQLERFIEILQCIEQQIKTKDVSRNY